MIYTSTNLYISPEAVGQKPGMSLASWVLKGKGPYVASALIGAPGAFWAIGEILTRQ
jgi:hypothetical protein